MKELFIDTNIVIDLLAERKPNYKDAAKLFSLADRGRVRLFISSLTIANTNYILSRLKSPSEAREILRRFKVLVTVLDLNDKIIELALNDKSFKDLEDGFQYYSALENGVEIIITRNLKDFKNSVLPTMTAKSYLAI